ncbi:MAG: hypothetical protein HUJ25_14705 [Crocinitomicaceae bacterium]|nr:hypothetical protein [Crocinitomicaceae bacterium]
MPRLILLSVLLFAGLSFSQEDIRHASPDYHVSVLDIINLSYEEMKSEEYLDQYSIEYELNGFSSEKKLEQILHSLNEDSTVSVRISKNNHFPSQLLIHFTRKKANFFCGWINTRQVDDSVCPYLTYLIVYNPHFSSIFLFSFRRTFKVHLEEENGILSKSFTVVDTILSQNVKEVFLLNSELMVLNSSKWSAGKLLGVSEFGYNDYGNVNSELFYLSAQGGCSTKLFFDKLTFWKLEKSVLKREACNFVFKIEVKLQEERPLWYTKAKQNNLIINSP